jgi:predicted MFS family arabinose efflux permease
MPSPLGNERPFRYATNIAVAACGATAFIDMYATQPLLPMLRADFSVSQGRVAETVSALTLAVALAALVVGPLADAIGRKRVILFATFVLAAVTFGASFAHTIDQLILWRFLQGLAMPGVFATTIAYISEEFPANRVGTGFGWYIGGNVLGGFLGRFISALVAESHGWQDAFKVLAGVNVSGAFVTIALLPSSAHFVKRASLGGALVSMRGFLTSPRMLATYGVGFGVLFTLVGAFTYATFYLAAPPFSLPTRELGNVFAVFLAGAIASPISGRLVDRRGNRFAMLVAMACAACGIGITLVHSLACVVVGLGMTSTGIFISQAASQGMVGKLASGGSRSTAAALYLTFYYVGGSLGAIVGSLVFERGGWPATVAMMLGVIAIVTTLASIAWASRDR